MYEVELNCMDILSSVLAEFCRVFRRTTKATWWPNREVYCQMGRATRGMPFSLLSLNASALLVTSMAWERGCLSGSPSFRYKKSEIVYRRFCSVQSLLGRWGSGRGKYRHIWVVLPRATKMFIWYLSAANYLSTYLSIYLSQKLIISCAMVSKY